MVVMVSHIPVKSRIPVNDVRCNENIGSWKQTPVETVCKYSNQFKNNLNSKTHKRKMCTQFNLILYQTHQNNKKLV